MYQRSMTAAIRRTSAAPHFAALAVLLALVFLLSWVFAGLRFSGAEVAPWWPAAAVSVVTAVAARGRRVGIAGLILLVSGLGNLLAGTDPVTALGFGAANAVEAWVVATVVTDRGRGGDPNLGPGAIGRLLIAVTAGAVAAGLAAGLTVVIVQGGEALLVFSTVAASHASAVLVLAPFALVPSTSFTPRPLAEFVVQVAVLALVVGFVFAPGQQLPLAFLPFPLLAWAAFRFGTGVVAVETALTVAIAAVLSFLGGGPFAAFSAAHPDTVVELLQVFSLALAVSMLLLSALQNDRQALIARLDARQRLLHGGIVSAHAGFLLLEEGEDDRLQVLESNPVADELFAPWLERHRGRRVLRLEGGPLEPALASLGDEGWSGEVEFSGGIVAELTVAPVESLERSPVLVVQAVDVTERRRVATALASAFENERRAAERLREINREKDDFVSSVSHELRTPLTSLLGYAEELEETGPTPEQQQSLEVLVRNARRLAALVDDLLVVSRTDSRRTRSADRVDAVPLLEDAVREVAPLARAREVELRTELPERLDVHADAEALTRIVINLLGNGVKFSPAGAAVRVSAAAEGDRVRLTVEDRGPGIPPEQLERVFERFHRAPEATDSAVPGTGLGLSIVRTLVESMGGSVRLESELGAGTRAIVELRAAVLSAEAAGSAPAAAPATD